MKMWRQGDVLIIEDTEPEKLQGALKVQPATDKVLVHGEATGHAHRVEGDGVVIMLQGTGKLIRAAQAFKVVHEEHDTIEIPEGRYRVVRQREWDESEIARYVTD